MVQHLQGNGADSLEDDFVPDDLVALSGEEDEAELAPEDVPAGDPVEDDPAPSAPANSTAEGKKRKRREKEKERKAKVCAPITGAAPSVLTIAQKRKLADGTDTKEPRSPADDGPAELAQYLAGMQAKVFSDMSTIELEDRQIPGARLCCCSLLDASNGLMSS